MITSDPATASARPIQNEAFGRRRKTSHVKSPTTIGVLLPSSVAFAAFV
jgi:hypothetical protein